MSGTNPNLRRASALSGFTLVEMMIALAIFAILAAIALPAFDSFIQGSRLRTYANDFAAAARLARSEALKRNGPVQLCKSANGTSCNVSGSWEQGWIVLAAGPNNTFGNSDDVLVRAWPAAGSGYRLTAAANNLVFQATGLGPGMTAEVCRSAPLGTSKRIVSISTLGRTGVKVASTSSCP